MKHKFLSILLSISLVAEMVALPEATALSVYAAETESGVLNEESTESEGDSQGDIGADANIEEGVTDTETSDETKGDSEKTGEGSDENAESEGGEETEFGEETADGAEETGEDANAEESEADSETESEEGTETESGEDGSETEETEDETAEADDESEEGIESVDKVDEEDEKASLEDADIFEVIKSNGYQITVYAKEGVFPEGTEVSVKKDNETRTLELKDKIQQSISADDFVELVTVFDITFSFEGKEIQPEEGTVAVAIALDKEMAEAAGKEESEIRVYHIADGDVIEEKKTVKPETIIPDYEKNTETVVGFETDSFSEYAVAVITEDEILLAMCGAVAGNDTEVIDATVEGLIDSGADDYVHAGSLPSYYKTANLPKLRDQNPYGTCWAHASAAMAEIYEKNHGGDSNLNLSELHTAYFQFNDVTDPIGGTAGDHNQYTGQNILNLGCNFTDVTLSLASWKGVASESLVPYSNINSAEVRDMTGGISSTYAYNDERHLTDMYVLDIKNNQDIVKSFIRDYGSVGIMYYAGLNSAYNSANNCYYTSANYGVNHAVTLVGWDDSFPASNFNTAPEGDGAWLVRNSWVSVDDSSRYYNSQYGYYWLSYYDKSIYSDAYYMKYASSENFDNNYQYDGNVINDGYSAEKYANVFTASRGTYGEDIKAVSIFANSSEVNYTVQIYKGLSGTDPTSGTLAATKTGSLTYAGYHTIYLDSSVPVNKGDKYSVVVSLKRSNGYTGYIGREYNNGTRKLTTSDINNISFTGSINQTCSASAGQSYYYSNGYWYDYGQSYSANFRIKAFTDNRNYQYQEVIPTDITFTDSTLAANGKSIAINETFTPGYVIGPQNADNKRVTWTSSNPSVASVSSSGTVTGLSAGQSVITVKTVSGNKSASFTVTVIGMKFSSYVTTFTVGESYKFAVSGAGATGTVIWSSTNPSVLSVDSTGKVTAKDAGTATIKATCGTDTISVDVTSKPALPTTITAYMNGTSSSVSMTWSAVSIVDYYQVQNPDGTFGAKIYPGSTLTYSHGSYVGATAGTLKKYTLYVYRNGISNSQSSSVDVSAPTGEIVYHVGTGQNNSLNPTWYRSGALLKIYDPVPPSGYAFEGWYTDSSYNTSISKSQIYNGTGTLHLYAKYSTGSYTIRLYKNDGSWSYQDVPVNFGVGYALPSNYVRNSYEFLGWNTQSDGTGTSYEPGEVVTNLTGVNGSAVYLYAQWQYVAPPRTYRITYILNGGKNSAYNPTSYREGTNTMLYAPTQAGFAFAGWYDDYAYSGLPISAIGAGRRGDITLYAKWTIISYTITLANMSGAGINSPYSGNVITFNKYSAFTLKKPTRTGYTFGGWYSDSRLKKKITRIKKGTIGDRTIYAKWTANKYKIKYNGNKSNGGSVKAMSCKYDGAYSIRANKYRKKGYDFIGWNTEKDGTGTWYYPGDSVQNLTSKKNGTVTLYAQWDIINYNINYMNTEGDGELSVVNNNPIEYNVKNSTIRLTAPTWEGHTFLGWYLDPGFKKKASTIKKGSTGVKTFYARWQ